MDSDLLDALLTGRIGSLTLPPAGAPRADDPPGGAILAGSFNPLHWGHEGMAAAATALTGLPVAFELAVVNADKGALAPAEVARRAAQFAGRHTLVLSRAPLFAQKAALYPGRAFVLGYDTAARLVAPRYYGGEAGMRAALDGMRAAGCRFLVAGRLVEGRFRTLADLALPPAYAALFTPIPEALFRGDVSSTALRAGGGAGPRPGGRGQG
ncbi:MAG TPA: hypothetical protein PKD53_09385 [Chloroflexaceae bacterium]|nr:hypothetical protein [Chloroflexaceae bacterium]